ncbi:MAG: redox-regulated ATPase YchF [Deltaproteobacteria bacterium]|jgi:GTP-binding protein YchF|nr:redox-regulated ATPase YchF [Deltaproteobacteria bacterium]
MKIAILGLSQSGKRTLFTLLTGRDVSASRKPGESVEGIAPIHDSRVDALSKLFQPKKTTYAENQFVLCPDITESSKSREWMDPARRCDLLCLVIRAFNAPEVFHPAGSVDPARDRSMIESELLLADMQLVETRLQRIAKEKKGGHTAEQKLEEDILQRFNSVLEEEKFLSTVNLEPHEDQVIKSLDFVTRKPLIYAYNVSEDEIGKDFGPAAFSISCAIESEISDIEDVAERNEFMKDLGIAEPSLERINAALYDALGLMSFYTTGKDECRAWTIRKGSTAPVAGGKIHSDIERGFIRVEVMKFDDLIAVGSEQQVKQAGKMQLQGKDYVIRDGDICHFLFNV